MAITDYTLHLENKFRCPTEAAAGVRDKRQHGHTALPWSSTPHVVVAAYIGTHDDAVNRTSAHHYKLHVPEAPLMLGGNRTAAYLAGSVATDWGKPRLAAMAKASLVIGIAAAAISCVPLIGVALAMKAGLALGLTWPIAINLICSAYLGGAVGGAVYECRWYANAKAKFDELATLSDGFDELQRNRLNEAKMAVCEGIVKKAFTRTDWALRQAALEYEAELRHHRPELAEPAQAA